MAGQTTTPVAEMVEQVQTAERGQTAEQAQTTAQAQAAVKFPRQGEWTYAHWLGFPDDGWTYEIIDGVLHMSPPPRIGHQQASISLAARMWTYARDNELGAVLAAPCGVRLPNQPVPVEPDILFVRQERLDIIGENYVEGAPDLIVEILSPSNADYDRETKFRVYEVAGVAEYWLVNYVEKTVMVYSLVDDAYELSGEYSMGSTAESAALQGFAVAVEDIFAV